jgi:hypothetical protein
MDHSHFARSEQFAGHGGGRDKSRSAALSMATRQPTHVAAKAMGLREQGAGHLYRPVSLHAFTP